MNFFDAAKQQSQANWKELLSEGESPLELDSFGQSPLSWIVKFDNLTFFEFAIQNGADPFFPHSPNGSVFHTLLSDGKTEYIDILIKHAPLWRDSQFILNRDKSGNLVFHLAVQEKYSDLFFFLFPILEKNPELLWVKNEEGYVLLVQSSLFGTWEDTESLLSLVFRSILEGKKISKENLCTLPAFRDIKGKSILHLTAENNQFNVLKKLIIFFENDQSLLEITDSDGNTALFLAAKEDATESLELLLLNKANPFAKNKLGQSIPGVLDKEKFGHSLKLWKKTVLTRFQTEPDFVPLVKTWLKSETGFPFAQNEIAKLNFDFLNPN